MPETLNEKNYSSKPCGGCGVMLEPFQIPAVLDLPARWIPAHSLCETCTADFEENHKKNQAQQRIDQAFHHSMLSPRFKLRTFETFQLNEKNKKAWISASDFQPDSLGASLLFYGPCGIGKTHLAAAIANRFIGKISVLYISCPELLNELREIIRSHGKSSEKFNLAKTVELLVLDDIGAEKSSDWVRETLFLLINHRYEFQRSTVFTTNCNFEELERRLGNRIVSRIIEMCRAVSFHDQNWRTNFDRKPTS